MATKRTASAKNKKSMMDHDTMSGFTIIEVVLVLAIAGLIFLMVFIALPQLQRAQRDTQRRNDLGRLEGAITQYQTNNNGKIPKFGTGTGEVKSEDFIKNYVVGINGTADDFADPSLGSYTIVQESIPATGSFTPTYGGKDGKSATIYYFTSASCDGETIKGSKGSRQYALMYKLEGSGVYCQDNAG